MKGFFDKENTITKEKQIREKKQTIQKKETVIPEYTKIQFNNFCFLKPIKEGDIITIDIETTGLKPQRKGHKIICIGITKDDTTAVYNEYPGLLHSVLKNPRIKKVIHRLTFENNWIKTIWGYWLQGIYWDTRIANHIIDNTANSGLKELTRINFQVDGYDSNIKHFLKAETSNGFNNIEKANINDIMRYCGYDAYFTNKLYLLQKNIFDKDEHLKKGFDFFMEGAKHFSFVQDNGICFDKEKYNKNNQEIDQELIKLNNMIQKSPEVLKLGLKEEFNFNSSKQLRELLFNVLKYESIKKTDKNSEAVDEEVLSKINSNFTKRILKHRYLSKIKDTYLSQFLNESVEIDERHYIFPFFDLTIPATYRSSSYNPNFQNIPVRDIYAKTKTRECLIPRKGRQLLETDFKGMEVAIGCCYHKDPNMIKYVEDKKNDMHKDTAALIFIKEKSLINKDERFWAKNGFVFPSFYGSTSRMYNDGLKKQGYGELTYNLWETISLETKSELKEKGIKDIFDFQKHIEKIETKFWSETFPDYHQWKFDNWRQYKEKGFIELYTGFRCVGKMGFNQVNNYRIQGTAFHVMLWCLIELNKYLIKNKMKSMIIGQIHDSVIFDIVPDEIEELKTVIKDICMIKVKEHFEWIIVPLEIEAEITETDQSWNLKKEFKL